MSDKRQQQTTGCFSYKWGKRDTYERNAVKEKSYRWLVKRYFGSDKERDIFLNGCKGKKLLDAGCGSAFSSLILFDDYLKNMSYTGVDISDAIHTAKERFSESGIKGRFLKDSITTMDLGEKFDIIFSEGVLHHTSDPVNTFKNLINHLNENGIIMFYVYKKKAPVREFTDDYIREKIGSMSDEEAWEQLKPLTKLGKTLGDLNINIKIDEDIDLLDIQKGEYNLQRLLYWFFIKMYYDGSFTIDEMNHINFDWFRPLNCYRFLPEEIGQWLKKSNLEKLRFIVEEAGITTVARKAVAHE
jgi:arsenite methyltransferase